MNCKEDAKSLILKCVSECMVFLVRCALFPQKRQFHNTFGHFPLEKPFATHSPHWKTSKKNQPRPGEASSRRADLALRHGLENAHAVHHLHLAHRLGDSVWEKRRHLMSEDSGLLVCM